jgi:hypothetical protein
MTGKIRFTLVYFLLAINRQKFAENPNFSKF